MAAISKITTIRKIATIKNSYNKYGNYNQPLSPCCNNLSGKKLSPDKVYQDPLMKYAEGRKPLSSNKNSYGVPS